MRIRLFNVNIVLFFLFLFPIVLNSVASIHLVILYSFGPLILSVNILNFFQANDSSVDVQPSPYWDGQNE